MKKQLQNKIRKLADEFTDAAAVQAIQESEAELEAEFDTLVKAGKTELDAYRQVLQDVEKMRSILEKMPKTESEQQSETEKKTNDAWKQKISSMHASMEGILWLATVMLYFIISFRFGHWHLTWLLFLSASMGSILMNMAAEHLKGRSFSKQTKKWHGLLWLAITEAYFLISFLFGHWHLTWLLFIGGALAELLIRVIQKWHS